MKATEKYVQDFRPNTPEGMEVFKETLNNQQNYYNVVLEARLTLSKYGLSITYNNL